MLPQNPNPTPEHPDNDPHLWLEHIDSPEALAWVEAQNATTAARLETPAYHHARDALLAIMDRPDNIPHVTRRGPHLYNFWRDAQNPRGLWRRTTLDSYRTDHPTWHTLLDLDALSDHEHEDWVWAGASTLLPHHRRAILRLSRGGGDAVTLREFDLETRTFSPDAFTLPDAKGGIDWLDADTLLLMTALGEGNATTAGYARTVRLWPRGTDPAQAPILFEVPPTHLSAWAGHEPTQDRIHYVAQIGFYESETWFGDRTGPKRRLDVPPDARTSWHNDHLAICPRTPWTVGPNTYPPDSILGTSLTAYLDSGRDLHLLFTPAPRRALRSFSWVGDTLLIALLDNLRPVHLQITPGTWSTQEVQGLPPIGTVSLWPLDTEDSEADGTLLALTQTPIDPPALQLLAPLQAPTILKRAPTTFAPNGATVTQHEAPSSDGTPIPYIQIGPPTLTGNAPVYMTGYGGFGASHLPAYNARQGKLWLEPGGTVISTSLRGGGEFGTWWHDAGRLDRKPLSHDDFAAIAQHLVTRGVTRPARIAAEGGSNGGLLIANMLTRYPERFGALFCTIPLIDMRRFHKLLAGASWIAEYGNPDEPADWAFIQRFSAYHNATSTRPYPPILLATTRKDDRVHPAHARKMAAKLQSLGHDALFHEPSAGGHGYGTTNAQSAAFAALGTTFLRQSIGWPG